MPASVGGAWPWRTVAVGHFEYDGIGFVSQSDCSRAVRELMLICANGVDCWIHDRKIRRRTGNDEVAVPRDSRICRESEVNLAGEPKSTNDFLRRICVVDLDELRVQSIRARGRIVHDLGDDDACSVAGRAQPFCGLCPDRSRPGQNCTYCP